eukprot:c19810_g1_i1 orf=60-440(+)
MGKYELQYKNQLSFLSRISLVPTSYFGRQKGIVCEIAYIYQKCNKHLHFITTFIRKLRSIRRACALDMTAASLTRGGYKPIFLLPIDQAITQLYYHTCAHVQVDETLMYKTCAANNLEIYRKDSVT